MDHDNIELQDVKVGIGLSSKEAQQILQDSIKEEITKYEKHRTIPFVDDILNAFYRGTNSPVDWFGICLLFVEAAVLLAGYILGDENTGYSPLVEGVIVAICAFVVITMCIRESRLWQTEVKRSLMDIVTKSKGSQEEVTYMNIKSPKSPSITTTWTYRDNKLVDLPWNLLVEGDTIVLGPSDAAPAQVEQIRNGGQCPSVPCCLDAGEVFNPPHSTTKAGIEEIAQPASCTPYPQQEFKVLEAPIKRCIRATFRQPNQRPQSVLNHDMRRVLVVVRKKVIWFFLIFSLFVNYVRYRLEPATVGHYSEVMLLATGYVLLPLSPILFPILWILVSLYGVARIRVSFKHSGKVAQVGSDSWTVNQIDYKLTLKELWEIVRGDPSSLPRTANLLHTLGNVTVFCCADKLGVLCYPNLTPAKVLMFKNVLELSDTKQKAARMFSEISEVDETKTSLNISDIDAISEMNIEHNVTEILNISYDPRSVRGIVFDDECWKNYMESLKPLGLNIILNSPCPYPLKRLLQENFTGHISLAANSSPIPNIRRCTCPLAKEIGFEEHASDNFTSYGQMFVFRPVHASEVSFPQSNYYLSIVKDKLVPSMVSVIVRDKGSGMFQLLTQGSADLILDACTDFWDGDDLCELSTQDRKKALDFYQRMCTTGHCVAFSYRPLIERTCPMFNKDIFIECPPTVSFPRLESDAGSAWSIPRIQCNDEIFSEPLPTGLPRIDEQESAESVVVDTEDPADIVRMLGKQIFIGMVTYHDLVKEDIGCLVESLNNGGIRFVYFSAENELRSRVFAEKLGLETGWNCHISLAPCERGHYDGGSVNASGSISSERDCLLRGSKSNIAEVNNENRNTAYGSASEGSMSNGDIINMESNLDSVYVIPNRAKLPRGIRNIRPHLKHVDDVPLLVPLFTDCSPQAVTEMIEIMQENGEVVCCLGSSLNAWNSQIFSQADVSVAIDPLHPQICVQKKLDDYRSGSPLNSDEENLEDITSLRMSSTLNGLPCSLCCRQDQQVDFVSLICEARRLMFNMRSCFLFMLSSYLSLSLIMLISFCMLLPFPLTGLKLLWLKLCIIPILSLSLIGTPADSKLMNRMTGKRISNIYGDRMAYFVVMDKRTYKYHDMFARVKDTQRIDSKQFLIHFFPTFGIFSAFTTIGLFAWMLFSFCVKTHGEHGQCHFLFGAKNLSEPWHGWITVNREGLYMSQDITLFFITLYLVCLSASFVYRNDHIWQKVPFSNKPWCKAVLVCLTAQIFFTAVSLYLSNIPEVTYDFKVSHVIFPLILAVLWPAVLLLLSEIMKKRQIKMFIRYQKRERLKFDTKLGMNSPV